MTSKYQGLENAVLEYNDLTLDCWFEYEPAERGSRERGTGLQLEPDYPEQVALVYAELEGYCVVQLMTEEIKQELEEKFLDKICNH